MGHHNRHFAGDPHSAEGVWSPPTSSANFCEEDYAVTLYIAEFINTLTNLAYVWFALRYPRREPGGTGRKLDLMSTALLILGINSFIYHATLRQTTQFCDEMSMFLLGGSLLQGIYTINQTPRVEKLLIATIWLSISILSAIYLRSGDILHHVYSFNSMMLLIGLRTLYLIFAGGRSKQERGKLMGMFWKTVGILSVAYILWQIDLEKCMELRRLREAVGLPWAWIFELHGWWHVLTALSASRYSRLIRELAA